MLRAEVTKIINISFVDGPGNRTVIFFQGCNFNCTYCHNPETINHCIHCGYCIEQCPTGALEKVDGRVCWDEGKCIDCGQCYKTCPHSATPRTKFLTTDDLLGRIKKNIPFIRGITTSGGECSLQRDFLLELFAKTHPLGLTNLMDSNGGLPIAYDEELMAVTDGVLLDFKMYDEQAHQDLVAYSNRNVFKNLEELIKLGKLVELRTVILRDNEDSRQTVEKLSNFLVDKDLSKTTYKLIKFRPIGVRGPAENWLSPSQEEMEDLKQLTSKVNFKKVIIT